MTDLADVGPMPWHAQPAETVSATQRVDSRAGLASDEAARPLTAAVARAPAHNGRRSPGTCRSVQCEQARHRVANRCVDG
jgi:hypothetical protein